MIPTNIPEEQLRFSTRHESPRETLLPIACFATLNNGDSACGRPYEEQNNLLFIPTPPSGIPAFNRGLMPAVFCGNYKLLDPDSVRGRLLKNAPH